MAIIDVKIDQSLKQRKNRNANGIYDDEVEVFNLLGITILFKLIRTKSINLISNLSPILY